MAARLRSAWPSCAAARRICSRRPTTKACAPGLILEDEIIRAFHATAFADRIDAASVAGSALDEFYGDRERIGDLIVATDARMSPKAFEAVIRQEAGRRAGLGRLKNLLRLVRR